MKLKNTNFINIKALFWQAIQILMKQQYLIGFLLLNKILNISLVTMIMRKIRPLSIFFPEKSEYIMEFDEIACMSFLMKDEEYLGEYSEILEKV